MYLLLFESVSCLVVIYRLYHNLSIWDISYRNSLDDDDDSNRELKCLCARTNLLIRRFMRCSVDVKLKLSKTFCIMFHDIAL